jgi:hypothetical protein
VPRPRRPEAHAQLFHPQGADGFGSVPGVEPGDRRDQGCKVVNPTRTASAFSGLPTIGIDQGREQRVSFSRGLAQKIAHPHPALSLLASSFSIPAIVHQRLYQQKWLCRGGPSWLRMWWGRREVVNTEPSSYNSLEARFGSQPVEDPLRPKRPGVRCVCGAPRSPNLQQRRRMQTPVR